MNPILFNADMVCATLDGRKLVTRRPVKQLAMVSDTRIDGKLMRNIKFFVSPKTGVLYYADVMRQVTINGKPIVAPYLPGDVLYVRETWAMQQGVYWHRAGLVLDENGCDERGTLAPRKWRPSIHMPREAARIFLRVTDIYPEPLFHITGAQAKAEGFSSRNDFLRSFFTIYPHCTMESFVWVIPYEHIEKPKEAAS